MSDEDIQEVLRRAGSERVAKISKAIEAVRKLREQGIRAKENLLPLPYDGTRKLPRYERMD